MRKFAKWVGGILAGLALTVLLILQLGFSDPLSAAMSRDKLGVWLLGFCQAVDAKGDLWRNEARGLKHGRGPLEWHGPGGDLGTEKQAELSDALTAWTADPRSLIAPPQEEAAEIEARNPPEPCMEGHTYSSAAVRGDLAFVATANQCGFDCATGGIVALRKVGLWWFPIAHLDTWIT